MYWLQLDMRRWLYENAPPRSLVAGFENAKTGEKLTFDVNMRGEVTGFRQELRSTVICAYTGPNGENDVEREARRLFLKRFSRWPQLGSESPSRSEIRVSGQAMRGSAIAGEWKAPGNYRLTPFAERSGFRVRPRGRRAGAAGIGRAPLPPGVSRSGAIGQGGDDSVLSAFDFLIAIPRIAVRDIKRSLQREAPQGRILAGWRYLCRFCWPEFI